MKKREFIYYELASCFSLGERMKTELVADIERNKTTIQVSKTFIFKFEVGEYEKAMKAFDKIQELKIEI